MSDETKTEGAGHHDPEDLETEGYKGQIKSEWIYQIINFAKNEPKIWRISALKHLHRAEILPIFWFNFCKIDDFINSFWLNLTFKAPEKKTMDEIMNLDKDDEALERYKVRIITDKYWVLVYRYFF